LLIWQKSITEDLNDFKQTTRMILFSAGIRICSIFERQSLVTHFVIHLKLLCLDYFENTFHYQAPLQIQPSCPVRSCQLDHEY